MARKTAKLKWHQEGQCIRTTSHEGSYPRMVVSRKRTTIAREILRRRGILQEVARHTCDHPWCINPEHLVSGTVSDNIRDRVQRNRSRRGKLGLDQILQLRNDSRSLRLIALEFGISKSEAFRIKKGVYYA